MGYGRRAELVDGVMQVFCTHCQQYRPVEVFNIRTPLLGLYQYYCKSCQAEMDSATYKKRLEQRGGRKIVRKADNPDPARLGYCPRCKQWRPKEDFNFWSVEKAILQTYCRDCQHAVDREHYLEHSERILERNRRDKDIRRELARAYIYEYLTNHACVDCGETDPVVLTFDHHNGDKVDDVSQMVTRGRHLDVIKKEVEKCEVVCHNCHSRRTQKRVNSYRWRKQYRE